MYTLVATINWLISGNALLANHVWCIKAGYDVIAAHKYPKGLVIALTVVKPVKSDTIFCPKVA